MAQAEDVARYLIWLASQEPEPELLTHLRVQKLLYYMQGWSLAMRGRPIFEESLEAWTHGPVVPEVYEIFADHKRKPFSPKEGRDGALTPDDAGFVESVWGHYKQYSANELRRKTHSETPWLEARGGSQSGERCQNEIGQKSMRDFFVKSFADCAPEGMGLQELERADKDFETGKTVSLADILTEVGLRANLIVQN